MKPTITKYYLALILLFSTLTIQAQKCDSINNAEGRVNAYFCPQKAINAWCVASKTIKTAVLNPIYENPEYSTEVNGTGYVDPIDFGVCPNYAPSGEERNPALFLAGDFEIEFMLLYTKSPIGMTGAEIETEKQSKLEELYKTNPLVMKVRNVSNTITEDEYNKATGILGNAGLRAQQKNVSNSFQLTIFFNSTQKEVFHFAPNYTIKKATPFSLPNVKPLLAMDVTHYLDFYDSKNPDDDKKYLDESLLQLYDSYVRLGSYLSDDASEKMRLDGEYTIRNLTVKVTGGSFEANHKVLEQIDWSKLNAIVKNK